MKYALLATTLVVSAVAASGSVFAADMPLKSMPAPVAYDWSGTYIGGFIGGGWGSNEFSDPGLGIVGTLLSVPVTQTTKSSGFIGGVEIGSNYQIGKLVVGLEADWSGGDIRGTNTTTFVPIIAPGTTLSRSLTANTDWTGTVATRIGIAHDHWLVYGKAGTAFAHTGITDNWTSTTGGVATPFFSGTGGQTRVGWMSGAGVEWAFLNSWSVKLEYDYLEFGSRMGTIKGTVAGPGGFPASFGLQNDQHVNQIKAGVNWRFMPNIW